MILIILWLLFSQSVNFNRDFVESRGLNFYTQARGRVRIVAAIDDSNRAWSMTLQAFRHHELHDDAIVHTGNGTIVGAIGRELKFTPLANRTARLHTVLSGFDFDSTHMYGGAIAKDDFAVHWVSRQLVGTTDGQNGQ